MAKNHQLTMKRCGLFATLSLSLFANAVEVNSLLNQNISTQTARYEIHDSWVLDKKTNLIWMRCSFGQLWHANLGCKGKPKGVAKIDVNAFPIMHNQKMLYWSSEQVDESSAWYADFENGVIDHYFGDYDFLKEKFLIRLVKDKR